MVRQMVNSFWGEDGWLFRANFWNEKGQYSSKTFSKSGEATSWLHSKRRKMLTGVQY